MKFQLLRKTEILSVAVFLGYNQYWPGGLMVLWFLCPGAPKGSTGSASEFKASQKTGPQLKVSTDRLGEAGNRTHDPWFTRHRLIPYTTAENKDFLLSISQMLYLSC